LKPRKPSRRHLGTACIGVTLQQREVVGYTILVKSTLFFVRAREKLRKGAKNRIWGGFDGLGLLLLKNRRFFNTRKSLMDNPLRGRKKFDS
jgi:hypothetical protein